MNYPLIISILALLFTIFSFWWMNWRRGNLIVGEPRSYAAKGSQNDHLSITIPLVFYNNGASAIVVQNLRILLLNEEAGTPLSFIATFEKLLDGDRAFATQFPVRGREAIKLICEFKRKPGNLLFEAGRYKIELQAVLDDTGTWAKLCKFDLLISEDSINNINKSYLVYDNQANN
jgi:hypothetical protein